MNPQLMINEVLQELERRKQYNDLSRQLRDISDPFSLPEENFRYHYRLTREAARHIFLEIEDYLEAPRRRTAIPSVIKFFTALHFFAHGSYEKSIGKDRHCSMSQASVSRALHSVIEVMLNVLTPRYIKFPTNAEEILGVKNGFYEKFNLPGVVGCIDCTHVYIFPPPNNHPVYPARLFVNRKGSHSINCQIICDVNMKILGINARYPGSVHDAEIWTTSNIKAKLQNNFYGGDNTTWLIGDSGYPLQPFLMTPIVGAPPDTPEGRYTLQINRIRNCIERCNGNLKGSFRCLRRDRILHHNPIVSAKIIYCCAILHNLKIIWNIEDEDFYEDNNIDEDEDVNYHYNNEHLLRQGQAIRNNIIQNHFM